MSDQSTNSLKTALLELQAQIASASKHGKRLKVRGAGTKNFLYPENVTAPGDEVEDLCVQYPGIVSYQPAELVLSVRASTPLNEVRATLAEHKQMLGFEPAAFGDAATIGGTVAAALSGPSRPYAGSIRDAVLGIKLLTGHGEVVRFGGEVMKNVAGYDVSRLVVGSMGSLGVILEVSLRVTPILSAAMYKCLVCNEATAFEYMAKFRKLSIPITGLAFEDDRLHIRLQGSEIAIEQTLPLLDDFHEEDGNYWHLLNEQKLDFFKSAENLWRIALPFEQSNGQSFTGARIWDWGGALCWLKSDAESRSILQTARDKHGSARLFSGHIENDLTLEANSISAIRERLQRVFDPHNIFIGRGLW